ncbi:hypothetical protein [uncultured Thiothrix sp.]|uniref:hypothetical protein n=1 Tax=uncultured Thiothrix sp. TaxID=223185 RepID=UPI0026265CFA|nr:hypothetical protein [uncultured Thiothrix sp.]
MLKLQLAAWLMSLSCLVLLPISLEARPILAPPNLIKIYKYQGSLQCEGGGEPLESMNRQLSKLGVKVIVRQCGVDGLIYPTVCGAPDGHINIFKIQPRDLKKAQTLGFDLLRKLPDAQVTACKPKG